MESKKSVFQILKSEAQKIEDIKNNFVKMLRNRVFLDADGNCRPLLEEITEMEDLGNNTFSVDTKNGAKYMLLITFQKLNSISKGTPIDDFLKSNPEAKKVVVASDYKNKVISTIRKNGAQIFKEFSLLHDIYEYREQPEYQILNPRQRDAFFVEYNTNEYTTSKWEPHDPMVAYFDLKKGDLVRITRANTVSGKSVDYRIYA